MTKVSAKQVKKRIGAARFMDVLEASGFDSDGIRHAFHRMSIAEEVIKEEGGNLPGVFMRMCPRGLVTDYPDRLYRIWCEERYHQLKRGEPDTQVTLSEVLYVLHVTSLRAPLTRDGADLMEYTFDVCINGKFRGEIPLPKPSVYASLEQSIKALEKAHSE